jgi:hypothetical protein
VRVLSQKGTIPLTKIPPHHWLRARRYAWDAIGLLSLCGIVYWTIEFIVVFGWFGGLVMSVLSATFGILAFQMLYPLWFRD